VDEKMVFHLANIFKRDFLIVHRNFKEMTEHDFILFDMLNGTNWNSVRFKIPIDDHIGWRVEFRTMEVQLTADENSAYSLLIHLITRVLHENTDLNLYIPISKLRENFERAHKRDALRKEKFFFRTNIHDNGEPVIAELTVFEILFGKGNFRGLFFEI
jgi:glutamate--cysteine ligase catalytic subunit